MPARQVCDWLSQRNSLQKLIMNVKKLSLAGAYTSACDAVHVSVDNVRFCIISHEFVGLSQVWAEAP